MVDPVTDDIAIEKLSGFIRETELEHCTQEEEQLIIKDTAAYLAADRSPEADVIILAGAFVAQILSPRTLNTSRTTATVSSCLTFLDFRVLDGWILFGTFISQTAWKPGQKANGAKVNVVRCYLWHHYLPPGRAWRTTRTRVTCFAFFQTNKQKRRRKKEGNNTNCWHWRCCTCNLCRWRNKGGRAFGCIWDWKTFQIHCSPRDCFKSWCKQIKSFACLSCCNWLWYGLILWLERNNWRPDTHELHSLQWRWLF